MSAEVPERTPYEFPWKQDAEGDYITFKHEDGVAQMRPTNAIMYLFPDQPEYDHVFIITEDDGDSWQGIRLFRPMIDKLAPNAFGDLCDQMFARDFELAPGEEPSEEDIEVYRENFPEPVKTIDELVRLAMRNIDAEIDYYLGE